MLKAKYSRGGFTLVEILIVVVILGILAVVVIPQFTNASSDARTSSISATLKTIREQIEVYKVHHKDQLPNIVGEELDGSHWRILTSKTDINGLTEIDGANPAQAVFGPYLHKAPLNPVIGTNMVVEGDATTEPMPGIAFIYDYGGGTGTGKIWAVGKDAEGTPVVITE